MPTALSAHPFGVFQDASAGGGHKGLRAVADLVAHPIHRLGHLVGCVAGDLLFERRAEDRTSGQARPASQPLSFREDLVGHRNRYFHTKGITLSQGIRCHFIDALAAGGFESVDAYD